MATSTLGSDLLTSTTNTGREPWQEQLERISTVPASKVLQAAEVIRGFAGSWAGAYLFDEGVSNPLGVPDARTPGPQQIKVSRIGQFGYPEINFAPYSAHTNRFGHKGGSLIGHPISFSVVGPTAKNSHTMDWCWAVTDNSAVPGTGDYLDINPAPGTTIPEHYGFNTATLKYEFPGDLYLLISYTGSEHVLHDGGLIPPYPLGGIGDGMFPEIGPDGLVPRDDTSKYEIFKVHAVTDSRIELDPGKRLASYFTIPGVSAAVAAITLITPVASRLVAVPCGQPKGEETIFAVMPPRRVSNHDEQYPFDIWTAGGGWNEDYPTGPNLVAGTGFQYRQKPLSPILKPKDECNGRVWGEGAEAVKFTKAGEFALRVSGASLSAGDIIHVHNARVLGDGHLAIDPGDGFQANLSSLLGWFEVTAYASPRVTVRRYEECNPQTGRSYIGSPESLMLGDYESGDRIELDITAHDPVTAVWTTSYADIDKINSARLTNLIDPRWVERSAKQPSLLPGVQPARADKAIFNTGEAAGTAVENPGSLLDLGFRPVLFAAVETEVETATGTEDILFPKFSLPVEANDVILDPSVKGERQYIDIDYANGLVRLSHPIKSGSPLYDASVAGAADNPRGEMVLFMSCVPYSMEEGQLGSSVRVTGGSPCAGAVCATPAGQTPESTEYVDSYSERVMFPLNAQTISSGRNLGSSISLNGSYMSQIPPTGVVELLWGTDGSGGPLITYGTKGRASRASVFGYTSVTEGGGSTELVDYYGGGIAPLFTVIDAANPAVAVFRRDVVLPNDRTGKIGSEFQFDTTYGSAKRAKALRVSDSEVTANLDGTVTVKPRNTAINKLFNDLFSSWLLSGGVVSDPDAAVLGFNNVDYAGGAVIIHGVRREYPAGALTLAEEDLYYAYVHQDVSVTPSCIEVLTTDVLPLPDPEDILLAKVDTHAATLGTLDLRNPLQDVNQRVDIYVGDWYWSIYEPYFATLREAVNYVSEVMTPESGTYGRTYRIRVVGHTHENMTDGPIVIKTDGLVIEGAPWYETSGAPPTYPEVRWTSTTESLFDLNGHNGLVFRDLAFRTSTTIAVNATANYVFLANLPSADITIDNCKVHNYVAGFIFGIPADAGVAHKRWTITRNYAETSRTGISITDADGNLDPDFPMEDFVIADNSFIGADIPTSVGLNLGPRLPTTFYNYEMCSRFSIARNKITGYTIGVLACGNQVQVSGNYMLDMLQYAVALGGQILTVEDNRLLNIYTQVVAGKKGIYLVNGVSSGSPNASAGSLIQRNEIWLASDADPDHDYCIWAVTWHASVVPAKVVTGGYNVQILDNACHQVVVGPAPAVAGTIFMETAYSRAAGNRGNRLCVWGSNNLIEANTFLTIDVGYDLDAATVLSDTVSGVHNHLVGNYAGYKMRCDQGTYLTSNYIGGDPANADITGLTANSYCKMIGNYIGILKDWSDLGLAAPTNWTVVGNHVEACGNNAGVPDGRFDADSSEIHGNLFVTDVSIDGDYTTFCGNRMSDDFNVYGDYCTANGNQVVDVATLTGSYVTFDGNWVGGDIVMNGGYQAITGNHISGAITSAKLVGYQTITGNMVGTAAAGTNNIDLDGNFCTVSGNVVKDDITLTLASSNNVINGNWVGGDIAVTSDATPKPTGLVVVGNHVVGNITNSSAGNPPNYVAVGNHAAATVFEVAVGAARDAAHNVSV